jgi:hypothetical protein
MSAIWSFLKDSDNRAVIFGILGFAWTVFIYFFPRPKKGWGAGLSTWLMRVGGASSLRAVFWLSVTATAMSFAYYVVLRVQPVVRVCEGQFVEGCATHDVFVGCYGLAKWKDRCWHYKYIGRVSVRDGNMCGYTIDRVRCGDSFF